MSKTIYPLENCPVRDLGAVDPTQLARLHALLTPSETLPLTTSTDTKDVFDRVMPDCPAPQKSFASPEYIVPPDARWVVYYVFETSHYPLPTITVDNLGNAMLDASAPGHRRIAVATSALAELRRLISRTHEQLWQKGYSSADDTCTSASDIQITRFFSPTDRRLGPYSFVKCDASGVPPDLSALDRFIRTYFAAFIETPDTRDTNTGATHASAHRE